MIKQSTHAVPFWYILQSFFLYLNFFIFHFFFFWRSREYFFVGSHFNLLSLIQRQIFFAGNNIIEIWIYLQCFEDGTARQFFIILLLMNLYIYVQSLSNWQISSHFYCVIKIYLIKIEEYKYLIKTAFINRMLSTN